MTLRPPTILLLLVAGIATNVAVAWGAVVAAPVSTLEQEMTYFESNATRDAKVPSLLCAEQNALVRTYDSDHEHWPSLVWSLRSTDPCFTRVGVTWSLGSHSPSTTVIRYKAGWPFRSVVGTLGTVGYEQQTVTKHMLATDLRVRQREEFRRFLPFFPLPMGFAVNTLLYTAVIWTVLFTPSSVRRHLRTRRGLCPECAYSPGDSSVCPECGTPSVARPVS